MRILTISEQHQIEQLKKQIVEMPGDGLDIHITYAERETWLNLMAIITQANEALQLEWRRSDNPKSSLRA